MIYNETFERDGVGHGPFRVLVATNVMARILEKPDDITVYTLIAQLNPDENPLPALEDMDPEEADGIVERSHDQTVRRWGDENSDSGFNDWLYQASPALYHQLLRLDVIARTEFEDEN